MATETTQPARIGVEDAAPSPSGVLALQGDYQAHARAFMGESGAHAILQDTEAEERLDRRPRVAGGRSTTMLKFLGQGGFNRRVFRRTRQIRLSQAGIRHLRRLHLLAREVLHQHGAALEALDVSQSNATPTAARSTQLFSTLPTELPGSPLEMVFIRLAAHRVGVEVECWHSATATRRSCAKVTCFATFHPEMSADTRVHSFVPPR